MRKVIIIGSSGAGKSVFSKELQKRTGLPLFHLDKLFWGPNWQEPDKTIFRQKVAELVKKEEWIIDGNYGSTIDVRAREADAIIFFDYPRLVCLYRAFKRFLKGRLHGETRTDIIEDCRERITWQFIRWIWTYPYKGRVLALKQIDEVGFPRNKIAFLRNDKEKNAFLRKMDSLKNT